MITMFKEDTKRELLSSAYDKAFDYLHYSKDERGRDQRKNADVRLIVSEIMMSNLKGRTSILHYPKVSPTKERLWIDKPFLIFPAYPKWISKLPEQGPFGKKESPREQAKLNYLNNLYLKNQIKSEIYVDMVSVLNKEIIKASDIILVL